jgi:predicted RNA methylase
MDLVSAQFSTGTGAKGNRAHRDENPLQLELQLEGPAMMTGVRREATKEATPSSLVAADLFCGAGGLSLGFQQAGFEIAFANDINVEYANTYQLNHGQTKFFRESVEDLQTARVFRSTVLRRSEIDILIGGPPCQGFSIDAPHRSKEDDRNQLFRQ